MAPPKRQPTYNHVGVDADGNRVPPPMNLDAEAIVLSAIILHPEWMDDVADLLEPDHFYSEANRWIYTAMLELYKSGTVIDATTVADWLRSRERLEQIGGFAYLSRIIHDTPSMPKIGDHAAILVECYLKRRAIALCQETAAVGFGDTGPTYEWLEEFAAKAEQIAVPKHASKPEPIAFAIRAAYEELQSVAARGDGLTGVPTGLRDLDRLLGGLAPGGVTVVGARPGNGKTSLALCFAEYAAEYAIIDDRRVAVFVESLEMKRKELALRQTFSRARVDIKTLRKTGKLETDDWQRLAYAANELSSLPIWVDDTSTVTLTSLKSNVKRATSEAARRGFKMGLVIVDYLQLMSGRDGVEKGANREQEIASMSRRLKQMAQDLAIHVIVLSQLNRQLESRAVKDKRPKMSDLRESGAIEQDADNIIMIYRDELYNEGSEKKGIAELLIEKQRAGQMKAVVDVRFTPWCTRFDNLAPGDAPNEYAH